jgi:Mn2+/Fe2+ NRAMP family transporter
LWITYHRKANGGHFIEEISVIKLFRRNYARDLIISFGYLYELFIVKPDPYAIIYHLFIPSIQTSNEILVTVGIIGATVIPHAIFVYSWLTKNKANENKIIIEKKDK